jgi:membrane protein
MFKAFRLHGLTVGELLRRLYHELDRDDALGMAGQLAYFALLSIFPFLIFLLTLIAYLPVPDLTPRLLSYMSQVVPAEALRLVAGIVMPVVARQHGKLLTVSLLFSIWTASMGLSTFSGVINRAHGAPETRPYLKRKPIAIGLTIGLSVFIIIAMALLVIGPPLAHAIADKVGLGAAFEITWLMLRWPVVFVIVSFALALLYYFAPNVKQRWHWITPGSVVATVLWILFSEAFAYYVRNFEAYNKVYGSIGTVVVLMMWLYLSALSFIIGAELNAEIDKAATERRRLRDDQP